MVYRGLLLIFLLLQLSCFCYSLQLDTAQLTIITDAIDRLSEEIKGERRASEKIATALTNMFSLLPTGYLSCEKGWHQFRSTCYFVSEDAVFWDQALQNCRSMQSELVKISRDDEYYFLRDLVKGNTIFVGLSDSEKEGVFRWAADGSIHPMVRSWWDEGEPGNNGRFGEENCVVFYDGKDNRLNDISCLINFRYMCEKPATPQ